MTTMGTVFRLIEEWICVFNLCVFYPPRRRYHKKHDADARATSTDSIAGEPAGEDVQDYALSDNHETGGAGQPRRTVHDAAARVVPRAAPPCGCRKEWKCTCIMRVVAKDRHNVGDGCNIICCLEFVCWSRTFLGQNNKYMHVLLAIIRWITQCSCFKIIYPKKKVQQFWGNSEYKSIIIYCEAFLSDECDNRDINLQPLRVAPIPDNIHK